MMKLSPPDSSLFFSRRDPQDPRLGDLVKSSGEGNEGVAIVGYPDDEGIKLNGGRLGAAEGPREIRRWLYRMTPHARRELKTFWDLGDLKPSEELAQRHESARAIVAHAIQEGAQVLSLGGGNDYAYADGMGFLDQSKSVRPLIVNVDAHLDVRDTSKGLTSGTPFYRLLESGAEFDFLELGIQAQCNSRAHWEYVEGKGGKIISLEEILDSSVSMSEYVTTACGDWILRPRPAFLAIDMDAFSWPYAQGTSAAWPIGIDPNAFWTLLQTLLRRLNVSVLGLYEVSPALDNGGGTARLAAQWAHCYLHDV
jgi:formiminoglutamase